MSNSNRKAALGIIGGKGMPPLGLLLAIAAMAQESEAEQGHAKAFGSASPFNKSGSDDQAEAFADAMMEVLFGEGCGECEGCKNRAKANAEAGTNNKPVISGKKLAKGLLQVAHYSTHTKSSYSRVKQMVQSSQRTRKPKCMRLSVPYTIILNTSRPW